MKFRSKPKIIEAEQFLEGAALPFQDLGPVVCHDGVQFYVETIHAQQTAIKDGDWIILESDGEPNQAYPCKPLTFEKSYELLDADKQKRAEDDRELASSLLVDVDYAMKQLGRCFYADQTASIPDGYRRIMDGVRRAYDAMQRTHERLKTISNEGPA